MTAFSGIGLRATRKENVVTRVERRVIVSQVGIVTRGAVDQSCSHFLFFLSCFFISFYAAFFSLLCKLFSLPSLTA